ncbi:MAG: hypothetical protein ACLRZQ_08420 [Akkermansia muciniphila]
MEGLIVFLRKMNLSWCGARTRAIFYVAFIKAPWLGVFELNDEGFSLCDED